MGKLRGHVRNNVVGYVAVFIALSGTAYAAVELEKNDVTSKHLKNGGVKTKDLANDAVTSPKVANGSLLGEDFAAGQLPQGPQGPQGEPGVQGKRGPEGLPGTARAYARVLPGCEATCSFDHAKGVAEVEHLGVGQYCVRVPGVNKEAVPAVTSVDWSSTLNPEGNASAMPNTTGCQASEFGVITERHAATDNAEASDTVGFTFIVP